MAGYKDAPYLNQPKGCDRLYLKSRKDRREAACVLLSAAGWKPPILSLHGRGKLPEIAAHI